jgi:hypothetical protein
MKIQLKTRENKVLYELEKSELFPSYRSVLVEAISVGIDLTGLRAVNEEINNVDWKGASSSSFSFENCSMKKNKFIFRHSPGCGWPREKKQITGV